MRKDRWQKMTAPPLRLKRWKALENGKLMKAGKISKLGKYPWWSWNGDQWRDSEQCRSGNSSHASSKATSGAFVVRQFVWFAAVLTVLRPTAVLQACTFTLQKVSPLKFLQLVGVPLLLLDALFCFCLSDQVHCPQPVIRDNGVPKEAALRYVGPTSSKAITAPDAHSAQDSFVGLLCLRSLHRCPEPGPGAQP